MSNQYLTNKQIPDNNSESLDICKEFDVIVNQLVILKTQISTIQQKIKSVEKNIKKQMKSLNKEVVKNKNKGNRNPSGFAKPTKITNELCLFLNKKEGSEIARTEVTSFLSKYIRENNLQNTENKKYILPDEKLKFLLGLNDNEPLTYFNLQKYMNKHFLKYNNNNIEKNDS